MSNVCLLNVGVFGSRHFQPLLCELPWMGSLVHSHLSSVVKICDAYQFRQYYKYCTRLATKKYMHVKGNLYFGSHIIEFRIREKELLGM